MKNLRLSVLLAEGALALAAMLAGCSSLQRTGAPNPQTKPGRVRGGQQPVTGATIQVYAVGTAYDGSAATPLLTPAVTSDANGEFTLPNGFCPSPSTLVYIVATGGNPGLAPGTNNAAISLMAAIGPCSNITSSTFINIDELTTVAAVWALAPYTSSYHGVGSGPGGVAGLANAFTLASELANTTTGTVPGLNVPAGMTVPVAQINTLADILAACVNSAGGVAGDGSVCGTLFANAATLASGVVPVDVIGAGVNIANNPDANVASLFGLASAFAPYQPALTAAPSSFAIYTTAFPLSISPTSLTFPAMTVGFPSQQQIITLTNTSSSNVYFYGISLSGTNPGDFTQGNSCVAVMAPADTCAIQVGFTPTGSGVRNAVLTVSLANSVEQQITLTGTGTAGTTAGPITLSPASLSFNELGIPQTVTLTNNGSTPLAIGSITVGSDWSQTNNCGSVLDAQSICTIQVSAMVLATKSVSGVNVLSGMLTVVDDAIGGPQAVQLSTLQSSPVAVNANGAPLTFGDWAIGTTSLAQTFTASADRYNPVSLSANITGSGASDFSLGHGVTCTGITAICSVSIVFTPSAVGIRSATLVTSFGNITLAGNGTAAGPSFTISPTNNYQLSFPIQANLNTNSYSLPFTITNNGSTNLQLTVAVSGPAASEFAISNTCTSAVSPSGTCLLGVTFTPVQAGLRSSTLIVTDTASGQQRSLALSGIGEFPGPTVTPAALAFGSTQIGSTSPAQTLTVSAPNGDPVKVVLYQGGSGFPLDMGSCWSATPCQISVEFSPTVTGNTYQNIEIVDTITGYPATASFSGMGGLPQLSLSSTALTFAARNQGSTSIPQPVTLTNAGNAQMTITGISLTGTNPGDFSIQSNTCTSSLAAGANCTFSISFSPTASGARSAALQIVSNAASSPDLVQLTGTGN